MTTSRKPDEGDRQRGRSLARLRRAAGMTQATLAQRMGLSTQQIGKYERGENRMSVSRYEVAMKILGQPSPETAGFAEEAVRFPSAQDARAELTRILARMKADLARCEELARSI